MKVILNMCDLLRRFFSPSCLLCDASCSEEGNTGISLCIDCQQDLPWILHQCKGCALPLENTSTMLCGACQQSPWLSDQVICLLHYASPVDYLIKCMKFGRKLSIAKVLGHLIVQHVVQNVLELPDAILPVPLHKKRLRTRGFNQAQELYRELNKVIPTPLLKGVTRSVYTEAQTLVKGTERAKNLSGAFTVMLDSPVPKHVVIIDDVVTTGATSNELTRVLKAVGVEKVTVWAVARTTPH